MSCGCGQIIENSQKLTGCVCQSAGFCERHQCHKNGHFHMLCQSRPDYFALWETGKGPCIAEGGQQLEPTEIWFGLGDMLAAVIFWLSFGMLYAKTGCGCERRKWWLNRVRLWRITS